MQNQQDYWESHWQNMKSKNASSFAKKCYQHIKNKNYQKLLDLGCGDGADSIYFAGKSFQVFSVDFSKNALNKLNQKISKRKIKNIQTFYKSIDKIDFNDNYFDVIYAYLSLHYFDDKTTSLIFNKIHSMLKKNGMFFVKCKSTDDHSYGKGEKVDENIYFKSHLKHFFDKNYMKEKLDKFKILKLRKTSGKHDNITSSFIEAIATKIES